jgi:hypothetical protein
MPISRGMSRLRPDRFALAVGALVALIVADAIYTSHGWHNSDFTFFAAAGRTMLSPRWAHTFHDKTIQAAPLELMATALLQWVGGWSPAAVRGATDLVLFAAIVATTRSFAGRRVVPLVFVVVAALVLGVIPDAYSTGHLAEPAAGLLWLVAARDARADRVWRAGLLVGVSACFELWGILGVTVLALAPSIRRAAVGVALAAAILALALAPFVLAGDFHMFQFQWTIEAGPINYVVGAGHRFGWPLRMMQGAAAVGVGGGLARLLRKNPASVFIVPAATVTVRLLLDPLGMFYYWDPLIELALIGAATAYVQREQLRAWAEAAAAPRELGTL